MKVTIRLLKGDAFAVEVEPQDTVECVKSKVGNVRSELANIGMQKLIWKGKVLVDDETVGSYGIQDNDVLVAMATKPKPKPEKIAESELASTVKAPPEAPVPEGTPPAHEFACSSASADEAVKQLCDMGFDREQVQKCLHAAHNNADRAVEYLMSGIPDSGMNPVDLSPPATTVIAAAQAQGEPPAAGTTPFPAMPMSLPTARGAPPGAFDELRSHPHFDYLAQMVTQQPQMFQHILPELAQTYPDVVNEIRDHPGDFMRFLQGACGGQQPGDDGSDVMPHMGMSGAPGRQAVAKPSREEAEAIDRLQQLGFNHRRALEAYFACDKNEELAANYLLEHIGD